MSKLPMNMEPGYMALSIYYQWMSSRCGSLLDSQPIQEIEMSVKEYYHQFCDWKNKLEAVNYVGDEESYDGDFIRGLKKGIWVRMLRYKWIRKLTDALRRAEIEEIFLSWEENPVLIDDEEFEDELQGVEVVSNEKIDEIVVQIDEDSGKIVSPNAHDKVLDELPKPVFTVTAAYVLIDDKSELNSHTGAPPNRVLGYSEHDAFNMLNTSTGLVITGLNSSPEKLIPVEFVMVKAAYKVFDIMPQLTFVWPFEEIVGAKCYMPLSDCVPKVFDPGDGNGPVAPFGWRFNEIKDSFDPKVRVDGFGLNMVLTFIFNLGGSFWHSVGCDSINSERMNAEAVVVKYEYGAGDISSKHGSVKVLHWDKFVGGSESITVRYPFMEQSKFWNALLLAVSTGMEILSLIWDHGIVIFVIGKKNCARCDLWADELTSATFQLCVPDPCSRVSSLHHTGYVTRHSLEPRKGNSKAIMTVFDPGGILVCYNGCQL